MSVLIKGMEMPDKCQHCPFFRYYPENGNAWCNANILRRGAYGKIDIDRPADCPLVEIKTPHGRLIDADALMQTYCRHEFSSDMGDAMEILENYPTVIEAEEDQV